MSESIISWSGTAKPVKRYATRKTSASKKASEVRLPNFGTFKVPRRSVGASREPMTGRFLEIQKSMLLRSVSPAAAKAMAANEEPPQMTEIVNRITDWAGGRDQALAWYRSTPIPALGDQTAEAYVNTGRADLVRRYLDSIAEGGFA